MTQQHARSHLPLHLGRFSDEAASCMSGVRVETVMEVEWRRDAWRGQGRGAPAIEGNVYKDAGAADLL